MKSVPGENFPKDVVIRPYEPRDQEACIKLQEDANARWGATFNPQIPHMSFVVERAGKIVAIVGGRVAVDCGSVIDPTAFTMTELRDVAVKAWVRFVISCEKNGLDWFLCSVTSPTPGWVNFLKKRLGFKESRGVPLTFQVPQEWKKKE
jgi:hypothetical protein